MTPRGDYNSAQISHIDFGDGTRRACSYARNGFSEDCEVYTSSDGATQYCYHVYAQPGRYKITVLGGPDREATAEGELTIDVVANSMPISTPTFGTPRSC